MSHVHVTFTWPPISRPPDLPCHVFLTSTSHPPDFPCHVLLTSHVTFSWAPMSCPSPIPLMSTSNFPLALRWLNSSSIPELIRADCTLQVLFELPFALRSPTILSTSSAPRRYPPEISRPSQAVSFRLYLPSFRWPGFLYTTIPS